MCEQVCKGQGVRVTNLRASEKELRDELRKAEAECDRYKAALEISASALKEIMHNQHEWCSTCDENVDTAAIALNRSAEVLRPC